MSLQEYNFEVKYRPGSKNVVADALSRLKCNSISSLDNFSALPETFDPHEILQNIQLAQQQDPFCKSILDFLSQNILSDDPLMNAKIISWSRFMTISNNILFHLWSQKNHSVIKQVVVPESLR
jgi:hypothetical protein